MEWFETADQGLLQDRPEHSYSRAPSKGALALALLLLVLGLALLLVGAELLVRGASRLAVAMAIPPLVIGLTVVAFGTSAPELAVSIGAALTGKQEIALGNVVGSNIFNVLFILGLAALIVPLTVERKVVRLEIPIMIGVSLLLVVLAWNGVIGRVEGLMLVALGLAYTVFQILQGRRETATSAPALDLDDPSPISMWGAAGLVVLGLALLVLGSRWLVTGATAFARHLGISELVIGLTVIAAGTSLPEVATSVLASIRGKRDLAVGNVVGSNIFNILFVLGATCTVSGSGVRVSPEALGFDIPIMVGAAVACLPIFFTGLLIERWEGSLFLGYFGAYMAVLFLAATNSPHLAAWRFALLGWVAPLTLLALGFLAFRSWRQGT